MKQPAVYILASRFNGTLYTGVTANLRERVWQHRTGVIKGFTHRHSVTRLVNFEFLPDMPTAIRREKQIKGWTRDWKLNLINGANPDWRDRWEDIRDW